MKHFLKRAGEERGNFTTVNVLSSVVSAPGPDAQGLSVAQLRERIRLLDAIEVNEPVIRMDDRLHSSLCDIINRFQFGSAHRMLLEVLDDVLDAEHVKGEK